MPGEKRGNKRLTLRQLDLCGAETKETVELEQKTIKKLKHEQNRYHSTEINDAIEASSRCSLLSGAWPALLHMTSIDQLYNPYLPYWTLCQIHNDYKI